MSNAHKYPGEELALFEKAVNWKRYFAGRILSYIKGQVFENGAGIGGTTLLLNNENVTQWTLGEPDNSMQQLLQQKINDQLLPANCILHKGTIDSLNAGQLFDCIIYIDVLEHIENDKAEIEKAAAHLEPGGYLVVLSPAFNGLFSPFDKAIGHYRRYTKKTLSIVAPASLQKEKLYYLDSAGYFASLMNKLFLKQSYPTHRQVQLWDKWMVPVSKIIDRLFGYSFGKSILAVWKKNTDAS